MEYKDYYSILDVDRKAGPEEIKKAYRKLARKYHPDVNGGDKAAAEKFQEINEAHEVLSDPEKRRKYDQLGSEWQHHQRTGGGREDFNWGQWQSAPDQNYTHRTVSPEEFEELFGAEGGYSDFFENLFGRASRQQAGGQPPHHGPHAAADRRRLALHPESTAADIGRRCNRLDGSAYRAVRQARPPAR